MSGTIASNPERFYLPPSHPDRIKKNLFNDRSYIIAIGTEKASNITQHPLLKGKKKDKEGDEYFSNIIVYLGMKSACFTEKFWAGTK